MIPFGFNKLLESKYLIKDENNWKLDEKAPEDIKKLYLEFNELVNSYVNPYDNN